MVIETQIYEHTTEKKIQLLRQHHRNIGCKRLTARVCLLHDSAWSYTATTHLTQEKLNTITNTKVNLFCLHPFYNFFWNYPLWGSLKKNLDSVFKIQKKLKNNFATTVGYSDSVNEHFSSLGIMTACVYVISAFHTMIIVRERFDSLQRLYY